MRNQVAVHSAELNAAVPYYGRVAAWEDVPRIKAAMLCHFAEGDERINAGIPGFEEAMQQAGIDYQIYIYEGAKHQFNNDTSDRYHHNAATLAWERTVNFRSEAVTHARQAHHKEQPTARLVKLSSTYHWPKEQRVVASQISAAMEKDRRKPIVRIFSNSALQPAQAV